MSYHTRKVEIPVEKPMLYQKCGNCNNLIELNCGLKVVFVKENMLLFAHRSILVNIMNIYKWMGNRIEMRNGRNVNISRSNMPILKEAFAENVLRRIGR